MIEAGLSLGSNRGDRWRYLRRAAGILRSHPEIEDFRSSGIYASDPLYREDQREFLNAAAVFRTGMDPSTLLDFCLATEKKMGRRRGVRNGPRIIDIDIIYFGNRVIDDPDLSIPHPRMTERLFVLLPLCRLRPEWMHPVFRKTAAELLEELEPGQNVTYRGEMG